jgi:hypothetical protein
MILVSHQETKYLVANMSFNLLRTADSVSPRAVTDVGSSNIVVEFVDSKPQQQQSGKKKSRREQVVIEIDFTSAKPVPQPQQTVAVPQQAAATTKHSEPLKTTVDDRALEIARSFYGSPQSANIRSLTTRRALAELFRSVVGESPVSFAMVLFAMAKGMRVVNVFDSGEKLEWRNVASSSSSSASEQPILKKPATSTVTSTVATSAKKVIVTTDKEGWSTVVKGNAKPKDTPPAVHVAPEKPIVVEREVLEPVAEPVSQTDETKLIEDLQATKNSIRKLEAEIEILVDEHTSIQEQIKICPIERVVEFHRATITQLEHILDGMEAERVALIQHKNELCDKLKN